ncbi:hypothetical protein G6F35_017949 [Rhizopus arrhizus]|nr:hypothetical protein G6F35_017949 [Rhizopus arrhizus]
MRPELYAEDVWDRIVDINLKGTFNMCQAVHAPMSLRGKGKIINIGSILALASNAVTAAYSASKGGVLQLTRSLARAGSTRRCRARRGWTFPATPNGWWPPRRWAAGANPKT